MLALTRDISPSIARCELTHASRVPIDLERARVQHREYERVLESLGCRVTRLAAGEDMPDSVFIEDTAVVLPEVAIVTRPGAESRRCETDAVAAALTALKPLVRITPPATLDGGDVLVVGTTIFVGRTTRTSDAGIEQLRAAVTPFGYTPAVLTPRGCLHLKSAVTTLDRSTLLINPLWLPTDALRAWRCVEVDPSEPSAANVLAVHGRVICGAYPRTAERVSRAGFDVIAIDCDELAKAEGALTCCSLLVDV